jgi:hypothetical protein
MPSSGASFCVKCGSNLNAAAPQPVQPAAPTPAQPPAAVYTPAPAAPPKQGISMLAKVVIAFLVVIVFVGAAGVVGAIYVAHRVKQKVAEVSGGLLGSSGSGDRSSSDSSSGSSENVCRYLSKEDVSRALGVTVVAAEFKDSGCSYMVHGDAADLTAKHVAAIGRSKGADAQEQNMVENFAGTIFKSKPSQSHDKRSDENGNAPVLVIGIADNATAQMRLEKTVIGRFPGSQEISGIGDEALDEANAMMVIRKGNRLIRIMYTTCPCTTETIKPLARKLVAAM